MAKHLSEQLADLQCGKKVKRHFCSRTKRKRTRNSKPTQGTGRWSPRKVQ